MNVDEGEVEGDEEEEGRWRKENKKNCCWPPIA